MSKASVAQEPSMDEILASIRRIIETGEDRAGAATRPVVPEANAESASRGSQLPRLSERFEGRDFPTYSRNPNPVLAAAAGPTEPAPAAPPTETVVSFEAHEDQLTADLEQELAASWGHPESAEVPEAIMPSQPAPLEAPAPAAPIEEASAMSDLPSFDRRPEFEPRSNARAEPAPADRTGFQPANSDRPVPAAEDRYEAVTLPLTSEATGSLVASSFNDLAQAIRSGELRSIEAMAQEMLRPMLQEWLDDNLPRIVERLVRDEIERMSRGGRR